MNEMPSNSTEVANGGPMLDVHGLGKSFGGLKAVAEVDFTVQRGEIAALIGPNGAGKTTTFNLITGQARADSGRVMFDGHDITRMAPHKLASRGLVRSFQTAKMFPSMTVREIVMTAAMLREGKKAAGLRADLVLDDLGISSRSHLRADQLSLPDRQMVELGKCVALQPKMILLDEIMGGLNRVEADVPIAAIERLRDGGISFLLVEHVMPIVMSLADHIVVLDFGRRIAFGTPEEIAADPAVQRSYLGGAA